MQRVEVVVEVPRGGLVKRRQDGRVAFVSPLPCPFNYGSVPGSEAADGDPLDALILGPALPVGSRHLVDVHGVVRFVDADRVDDKLVCGPRPDLGDLRRIRGFFRAYALVKRLARPGSRSAFLGYVPSEVP